MLILITIISAIAGLASLGCWIYILIQMFKNEDGPVQGIIGIVTCGIWAFIWGWKNNEQYNLKTIMLAWSAAWAVSLVVNILTRTGALN